MTVDDSAPATAPSTSIPNAPTIRRFRQVDAFGADAFVVNRLAVIVDAGGLSDMQMQRIASWTKLSETSFLLTPTRSDAGYRVGVFTPSTDLDFTGHLTLGSAFAWLAAQGEGGADGVDERVLAQECRAGLIEVRGFVAPDARSARPAARAP